MIYINTAIQDGSEFVVTALPLDLFPDLDPVNLPEQVYLVPDGVQKGWVKQPDGSFAPKVNTPTDIIAEKKRQRQVIVDAIQVTTTSGKVFDGNEEAQTRMSRAIQTAQIANIPSTTWVLANNVPTTVTLAELQEALVLSMQAMGAVWATPYEE